MSQVVKHKKSVTEVGSTNANTADKAGSCLFVDRTDGLDDDPDFGIDQTRDHEDANAVWSPIEPKSSTSQSRASQKKEESIRSAVLTAVYSTLGISSTA